MPEDYKPLLSRFLENGGYAEAPEIVDDNIKHLMKCHYTMITTNQLVSMRSPVNPDVAVGGGHDGEYGLLTSELLLLYFADIYSKVVGKNLVPTYSYTRTYYKGSDLKVHTDRPACQYSMTINIGSSSEEPWPFFCQSQTTEDKKISKIENSLYTPIIYKGEDVRHWREKLTKSFSTHVFLHYVDGDDPNFVNQKYDKRPFVGQ